MYTPKSINQFGNALDSSIFSFPDAYDECIFPLPARNPIDSFANNDSLVDVLRLDQLHPYLSGNKAFKLTGHLQAFAQAGGSRLLSFGGVWSNHLHALAFLGKQLSIPTIGLVRGYEELPLTPTLQDCQAWGMKLVFCNKKEYAQRYDSAWLEALATQWQAYVIPEGGAGSAGERGFHLLSSCFDHYDEVWLAAGTGTTALGIAKQLKPETRLVVVNTLADQGALQKKISQGLCSMQAPHWQVLDDYHWGGFGRCPEPLLKLILEYDALGLALDPIYTAKLIHAFEQEYQKRTSYFKGKKVLLIHSGGLQGRRGYSLDAALD